MKVNHCKDTGCGWTCCQFQQGNYIVCYPGELAAAEAAGKSIQHLAVIDDDYNGGQKVVCTAKDTASCDAGYKPLDCETYPLFPVRRDGQQVDWFIKGQKCPLQEVHLTELRAWAKTAWDELIKQKPEVGPWLDLVELVGYTDKPATKQLKVG